MSNENNLKDDDNVEGESTEAFYDALGDVWCCIIPDEDESSINSGYVTPLKDLKDERSLLITKKIIEKIIKIKESTYDKILNNVKNIEAEYYSREVLKHSSPSAGNGEMRRRLSDDDQLRIRNNIINNSAIGKRYECVLCCNSSSGETFKSEKACTTDLFKNHYHDGSSQNIKCVCIDQVCVLHVEFPFYQKIIAAIQTGRLASMLVEKRLQSSNDSELKNERFVRKIFPSYAQLCSKLIEGV